MVDMSRMPDSAMFSVRGMGVAERVSTSTPLESSFSRSLWLTPKRCSSSTMSRPKSLNWTVFCSSLWVPMIKSTEPARSFCKVCCCIFVVRKRLRTSMVTGKPRKRATAV